MVFEPEMNFKYVKILQKGMAACQLWIILKANFSEIIQHITLIFAMIIKCDKLIKFILSIRLFGRF